MGDHFSNFVIKCLNDKQTLLFWGSYLLSLDSLFHCCFLSIWFPLFAIFCSWTTSRLLLQCLWTTWQTVNYMYKAYLLLQWSEIFFLVLLFQNENTFTVRPRLSGHIGTSAYPDNWFGRIWEICLNTASSVGLNTSYNLFIHCYSICIKLSLMWIRQ